MKTHPDYPKPNRRLRLGMVGGGRGLIGEVHANGARLSNRWELVVGAFSSDPALAPEMAQNWLVDPARSYGSYQEMAQAEAAREDGIDAVAIVTPNDLHAPVAKAFMERGIHVITDKPLTATLDEVEALVAAQQASGCIFAVTYSFSGHAMVRQARAMIDRGDLGDIRQVHVEYFQDWAINVGGNDADALWRFNNDKNGGTLTVADIGTHAEHLARAVTGLQISELRAEFHVGGADKPVEDTAYMHLRLGDGIPGTLMISQAFAGTQCELRIRVGGTKASLDWNAEEPEALVFKPVGAPVQIITRGHGAGVVPEAERLVRMPRGHPEALTDSWANLYMEVAMAVEAHDSGKALPEGLLAFPTIDDGVQGMRFVDAALRSNASGEWVKL